ncbi:hypothetical protein B0537_00785 [Desulforamulus ferrireducens]|uniref:Uncharacterized protein n=1 Tax=Desulforamulus ferrireducens TaxID=1833852 RepID=A0A1S6ISN3_9FIRM|nr:hypothetical protein B0537_00785 [Desulforamulus ferrireducens]
MNPHAMGVGAKRQREFGKGLYPTPSIGEVLKKANGQRLKAKSQKPMAYGLWPKAKKRLKKGSVALPQLRDTSHAYFFH